MDNTEKQINDIRNWLSYALMENNVDERQSKIYALEDDEELFIELEEAFFSNTISNLGNKTIWKLTETTSMITDRGFYVDIDTTEQLDLTTYIKEKKTVIALVHDIIMPDDEPEEIPSELYHYKNGTLIVFKPNTKDLNDDDHYKKGMLWSELKNNTMHYKVSKCYRVKDRLDREMIQILDPLTLEIVEEIKKKYK